MKTFTPEEFLSSDVGMCTTVKGITQLKRAGTSASRYEAYHCFMKGCRGLDCRDRRTQFSEEMDTLA